VLTGERRLIQMKAGELVFILIVNAGRFAFYLVAAQLVYRGNSPITVIDGETTSSRSVASTGAGWTLECNVERAGLWRALLRAGVPPFRDGRWWRLKPFLITLVSKVSGWRESNIVFPAISLCTMGWCLKPACRQGDGAAGVPGGDSLATALREVLMGP
jgi:hypothetical protein